MHLPEPSTYAKLSRPRVHKAYRRDRLFARLHQACREYAVVWIASPPGAGKTTLAASYVAVNDIPGVWYHVDHQDAEPATLFYFLSQAAKNFSSALPPYDQETAAAASNFARHFFREFYRGMPVGAVVVFDNIHHFDWEHAGDLMEIAFNEIPFGVTVFALSRHLPPARLSRLRVSGLLTTIDWNELRLDEEEARALVQQEHGSKEYSHALLEKMDGWAAGIVMLRDYLARSEQEHRLDHTLVEGRDAIFQYFSGEILDRMPERLQGVLLRLGCVPRLTAADAQQLTGDPAAAAFLESLYHNRWFIDRCKSTPATYAFHDLFREFLRHEARKRLDSGEYGSLLKRAADIYETKGVIDEAACLHRDTGDFHSLADLLLRTAGDMCASGRGAAWCEWTKWLPNEILKNHPWLCYWQGVALIHDDPAQARDALRKAEQAFMASHEVRGALLAMASIMDSYYYEWSDFSALPALTQTMMDAFRAIGHDGVDAESDLKISSRILLGFFLTNPEAGELKSMLDHVLDALPKAANASEQLAAGTIALHCLNWCDVGGARNLIDSLGHLMDNAAVGPYHKMFWARAVLYRYQLDGRRDAAECILDKFKELALDYGVGHLLFHVHFRTGLQQLAKRDLAAASASLEEMRRLLTSSRRLELAYLKTLEAIHVLQSGDCRRAVEVAEEAQRAGTDLPTMRHQVKLLLAFCAAHVGDWNAVARWTGEAVDCAYGPDKEVARRAGLWLAAYAHAMNGDMVRAKDCLAELLRQQRHNGVLLDIYFACFPLVSGMLFSLALREKIESDFVRRLVRHYKLSAPDRSNAEWPWPVAIRALGKLELQVQGEPKNPAGKAQQRPMALLKALLAAGREGMAQIVLARQLWPDAADPKASLHVTIHRLRKLLELDEAVLVRSGNVMLDSERVWTDADALIMLCERIEQIVSSVSAEMLSRSSISLLDLYHGPFCHGDEEPWILSQRENFRSRFLGAVAQLGKKLESLHEWQQAQQLYTRALGAEPLAETIYRGLMRCAYAQNDLAGAYSVYRQCRQMLSIVLGRVPSVETERLMADLGLRSQC